MTPSFTEIHRMSKWNEEDDAFIRDMQVRRKKKGSKEYKSHKTHDNRDALPFLVKVKTPDPYTKDEEMLKQARKNSAKKSNKKAARTRNVFGVASNANAIAASVYARRKNGELHQILGEFQLEKNTNCGDLLQVEDREFEVVKARSQFKYAGGKRFVMVRKILEVKEVTRIAEEAALTRLMDKEYDSGRHFE